jgi:hypothetical protein
LWALYLFSIAIPLLCLAFVRFFLDRRSRLRPIVRDGLTTNIMLLGIVVTLVGVGFELWHFDGTAALIFGGAGLLSALAIVLLPPDQMRAKH